MSGRTSSTDVIVIGGGPAGAACALRLARLGHRVTLVERAPRGRAHVGESLPPTVLPLLAELGLRERIEAAGFLRPRGALVQWDDAAHELSHDGPEPGFQVDRGHFDALLLDAAEAFGVNVLQPVGARTPRVEGDEVQVPLDDGRMLKASRVIDARGRRGAMNARAPATAALYAYWRGVVGLGARTRVEAGDDAWYWGAPLPDGSFNATVFVDARRCAGLDPLQRRALYRQLIARSDLLGPSLDSAVCGPLQVCDATPRVDAEPIGERIVKAGEAAFSIDPLSSQGVQAALRSALQAAACVHTMARRAGSQALVQRFYGEQVERAASRHGRLAAGFHAAAARHREHAFWQARRGSVHAPAARHASRPLPGLDERVRLDAAAGFERVPALDGAFIIDAQAVVHPGLEAPVSFIDGIPVANLLAPLQAAPTVRELLQIWRNDHGDTRAVSLLASLWRQGIVAAAPAR